MSILIVKHEYTHAHKRVYSYSWMSVLIPNQPWTDARPAATSSPSYCGMIQGKRPLNAAQNPPPRDSTIPLVIGVDLTLRFEVGENNSKNSATCGVCPLQGSFRAALLASTKPHAVNKFFHCLWLAQRLEPCIDHDSAAA